MAQPFTGASKACLAMRSTMAERFMRLDARGFHQGQEPCAPQVGRIHLRKRACRHRMKKILHYGGRPYICKDLPLFLELAVLAPQPGELLALRAR